jgi:ankyrin repeat protein
VQRDVRGILSRLPKTLDETYERVLRDIHEDNKEHARRLLHCLVVAVRPLRVEEFAEILTFDFDATEGDIPEYHADWRWKDQEEAVMSTCSSLITIADYDGHYSDPFYGFKRVVQFSHFSVKEFLMSNRLATPIRDVSQYHIFPGPAHTILAQACLGFLLHLDSHVDAERAKDFPLAQYAAEHWVAHAQFKDVASHVKCAMNNIFDPGKPYFASWVGIHDMDKPLKSSDNRTRPTPLYYSALCGFHDIAKDLVIKYPEHVNSIGGGYDTPLLAALSRNHVGVAELLLKHGGNVNVHGTSGRTALHTQLLHSYDENEESRVVRFLLEQGVDVNARDETHQTPLHILVNSHNGHHRSDHILTTARLLLEHGADVNATDEWYQTPLHTLCYSCYTGYPSHRSDHILTVVRLLLHHGADVHAPDNDHETPLHLVMRQDSSCITQILLERGADPNLKNKDGKAPLHILSECREFSGNSSSISLVAQLLLERGTEVNSRDKGHETPLLLACGTIRPILCVFFWSMAQILTWFTKREKPYCTYC